MKKFLALLLVLALAISCCACGNNTQKEDPPPVENTGNDTKTPEASGGFDTNTTIVASEGVTQETIAGPFGNFVRYTTPHVDGMKMHEPDTLWVGMATTIESGNPQKGGASAFYDLVFDKLIEYDLETGKLTGVVFKEYAMAEDNSYMTFTMHDNIYFHDGTHATAEDVFYTLQRCTDVTISQLADKNVFGNIDFDNSEITGEFSGKIQLFTPSVTFEAGLTKCWLLCKDYIERVGEDNAWWDNTVGSGPYKVESIVQGDRYNVVRNDNYWTGEMGNFKKMVIRYYAEKSTMLMDFETGYLDIFDDCSATEVEMIVNGDISNTICELYPTLNVYCLVFNEEMGNPALYDENVRKAICLALDPFTVNEFSWESLGRGASSAVCTALPDSIPTAYEQNIEEAKQALADAGYKPGELHLVIGSHSGAQLSRALETVQDMLIEVGFDAELLIHDATVYIMNARNAGPDTYDLSMGSAMYETLDSTALLTSVSHALGSTSASCVTDEAVDELALRAKAASSVEEKEALMKEIQQYLHDHYWYVPLIEPTTSVVYKDYLTGVRVQNPRMPDLLHVEYIGE